MLTTLIVKDVKKAEALLRMLPTCPCFPRISGFKIAGNEMRIVIPHLDEHPLKMNDEEFVNLVKTLYRCALQGMAFGPLTRENVRVQGENTVLIPNFNAKPRIINGRIENPDSFFATVQSLATIFKSSSKVASDIHRQKLSAIFSLMKDLKLKVPYSPIFLPSIGVWRHDKFVKRLEEMENRVFVPMIGGMRFVQFLPFKKIFTSISDLRKEVHDGEKWRDTFKDVEEFANSDLTTLALLFPVEEKETYVFLTQNVEMHTFCDEFRTLYPTVKIIEVLEPYFKMKNGEIVFPPRISEEELEWFLKTFFGSDTILNGDRTQLFKQTKGELFGISHLVVKGKWNFNGEIWEVQPSSFEIPSVAKFILKAKHLSRNGVKPNLGIEYVETAEKICGKNLESFESLKTFFYKVLGEYDKMKLHLEKAEAFGRRSFRSAYYAIVFAMNEMDFSLPEDGKNPLISIMKKYALLVSKRKKVEDIYLQVVSPLERLNSIFARRIECMARNYMATLLMLDERREESLDELETSLAIAKEYDFKDLEPLIELNLAFLLSKNVNGSYVKAFDALKHSMNEGLKSVVSASYMALAENSVEFGNFRKALFFLKRSSEISPHFREAVNFLKARMKVENLEESFVEIKEPQEKEELEFLFALYTDKRQKVESLLKTPRSFRLKALAKALQKEELDGEIDYVASYFFARSNTPRNVFFLNKIGREIYLNNINLRKIFYEEQLAVAYRYKGLKKSSEYHMALAATLAKKFGLDKRAAHLENMINNKSLLRESNDLLNYYLFFRYFRSTYEILESLALDVANKIGTKVVCELNGVEEYTICATPQNSWKCMEHPDINFSWVFGMETFTYLYHLQNCNILLNFKTKGLNMDDAIFTLDHIVPFYGLHVEKSMADRVSNIDVLTKLYTRRYISEKLSKEMTRAKRYKEALSVAMLDVDDFKNVNDTSGHDAGDKVMREIAKVVMENVRSIDVVGRYGGEEFLMIFPHTPLTHALKTCERIRKKVESARLHSSKLTVSIGLAQLEGNENSIEEIIKKADLALYIAKSQGKNKVVPFSAGEK